jgi:hypothetical protein
MHDEKKKTHIVTTVVDENGNIENIQREEVELVVKLPKNIYRKGEYYLTRFRFWDFVAENDYSGTEIKVLVALFRRLDYNNRIATFYQKDVALEAKSSQANVSRALKKFLKDEILLIKGRDYYFSPRYIAGAGDKNRISEPVRADEDWD